MLSTVTALDDGGFLVTWSSWAYYMENPGQDGSGSGVYGQRYDVNGDPIGGEFQINTTTLGHQLYSDVTLLNDGGFIVTWHSDPTGFGDLGQDGSGGGIYGQRYGADFEPIGGEFQINSFTAGDQHFPAVTALAGGGFVVTWTSMARDGDGYGIFGQRFDADGLAGGSEFQVNTFSTNDQTYPVVTPLDDGGFLVTWSSQGQDGSGWGIYGQRFDSNGAAIGAEFRVNEITAGEQYADASNAGVMLVTLPDGKVVQVWAGLGTEEVFYRLINVEAKADPIYGTNIPDTLSGTVGDDVINGWDAANIPPNEGPATDRDWLYGLGGNDSLNGGGGSDFLIGGGGVDTLNGGEGSDWVLYSDSTSSLQIDLANQWSWDGTSMDFLNSIENAIGGAGNDLIVGDSGDNSLGGGPGGVDFIDGGLGWDTVIYRGSTSPVTVDLVNQNSWDGTSMDFLSSIEGAFGGLGNDVIVGDDGDNRMLHGGLGGVDIIYGGGGSDTVSYDLVTSSVWIDLASQNSWDGTSMDFFNSIENAQGGLGDDYIFGDGGDNVLGGGNGGVDHIYGGGGSDTVSYFLTSAPVWIDLASQTTWDGTSTDFLNSIENADGSVADDHIFGDSGANFLNGEGGNDVLWGYGGGDTFAFDSALNGLVNVDLIGDFTGGVDKIQLSSNIFGGLEATGGLLDPVSFTVGSAASAAIAQIIYDNATGALSYDADGTGAGAAIQFASVNAGLSLSASDFTVPGLGAV